MPPRRYTSERIRGNGGFRDVVNKPILPPIPLRAAREALGIDQKQLAALSGVSAPVLCRIERRQRPATEEQKIAIASVLRVRVRDLFGAPKKTT
jgi:DNA-binding XRE family transcriptional regulator